MMYNIKGQGAEGERKMEICFAPMEGVTTAIYRRLHRQFFPGVDRYYIPFFSPTPDRLFTPRQLGELLAEHNRGVPVVPQILTRSGGDFLWAARGLKEMGYEEVNLNLGCPSGTVFAKGKGAGLLLHPDRVDALLEEIFRQTPLKVSVKTRLGVRDPGEFPRLLEIYNRYPLSELIVHARTRTEMYRPGVHQEAFALALEQSRAPVCCNGDLFSLEDCRKLEARFPTARGLMLGRGLAANPALARQLRGGGPPEKEELLAFHTALREAYREEYGPQNGMRRMKELWRYMACLFEGGDRLAGKIARTTDCVQFDFLVEQAFQERALLPSPQGFR